MRDISLRPRRVRRRGSCYCRAAGSDRGCAARRHDGVTGGFFLTGALQAVAGVIAGFGIGIVASLLGVAGGELLIPTLLLLFGVEIKLAGSLSLAVSLPTMLTAFTRYNRDRSFEVLGDNRAFVVLMAGGSIVGSFIGGLLLGIAPSGVLLPVLAAILLISAGATSEPMRGVSGYAVFQGGIHGRISLFVFARPARA
jgi:Sulfite exporter TauE/SafE